MERTNKETTDYLMGQVAVLLAVVHSIMTVIDDKTLPGLSAKLKETLDDMQSRHQTPLASMPQPYKDGARDAVKTLFQ